MTIRPATEADVEALAACYRDSVLAVASAFYTEEQVRVWACFGRVSAAFRAFILEPETIVAVSDDGEVIGFAGLESDGHVASLYVSGAHMRRGVGSRLMKQILTMALDRGIRRMYAEASDFSRRVFEKCGFSLAGVEEVERGGVSFERYLMVRELSRANETHEANTE